jgi:hypothetical protein
MISRRDVMSRAAGAVISSPLLLCRADAQISPDIVRFRPEMEPLVGLIERTPRVKCAEMAVDQLRKGVPYRQFLGALFLAGVRDVNPRPPGFALHCVFVIHAAHLISLEAPPDARLLPLFFALDNFKTAQERDANQKSGDYTMRVLGGALPGPERASAEFAAAMEAWDIERAERAIASLARHSSAPEVFSLLWRYGARDYRNIGHKAIFVANAYRTLQAIGWQHAEPVLRSLALGLLDFGRTQQVNGYALDDQCYAGNLKRLRDSFTRLNPEWMTESGDAAAASSYLAVLRSATPDEICGEVAARLMKDAGRAGAVWDAVHLAAAELRMRMRPQTAITGIHAVTAASALHHSYLAAGDPQTRFLLLLQAAGWMGQFRTWAEANKDNVRAYSITGMEPGESGVPTDRALAEIFSALPGDPDSAAARVLRLAPELPARQAFFASAIRLAASKADEVHYMKYLAALLEDVPLVSAGWQPHLTAAAVYYMKGSGDPEAVPMKRAREALRALAS